MANDSNQTEATDPTNDGMPEAPWTAKRILWELASPERRQRVAESLFRHEEPQNRHQYVAQLAMALRFRPQAMKKLPLAQRAKYLLARANDPTFAMMLERGLLLDHTQEEPELLTAFLNAWEIPHEAGTITSEEEIVPPSRDAVDAAVAEFEDDFDRETLVVYLATAGLLMGSGWAEATWPAVARLIA